MNFLSHFYFEKETADSYLVMGTVLPDLIKNAQKDCNLYPQKKEELFTGQLQLASLLDGWKRHLAVDRLFHSSTFFITETAKLKHFLLPILGDSKVRPSFLAHIGVELLLDHLLVVNAEVDIDSFYNHLSNVDGQVLGNFLNKCGHQDRERFFNFLNSFRSSRYLLSYQKIENISYALQRICMRIWTHPFHETTITLLTDQLSIYKQLLEKNYQDIFIEIEAQLKRPT